MGSYTDALYILEHNGGIELEDIREGEGFNINTCAVCIDPFPGKTFGRNRRKTGYQTCG